LTISYPSESFSIDIHILIMIVATIVATVGLFLGAAVNRRGTAGVTGGMDAIVKDIIPISGIILAFVGPVVTGVSNPVLDYSVSEDIQDNTLEVKINNYGLVTAKAIEVYFNAPGIKFSTFNSMPMINGTTYLNSTNLKPDGNAVFFISALPPRSETKVTAHTRPGLATTTDVTVYVRSDTSTGVHNLMALTTAYVIYGSALAFSVVYIIWKKWKIKDFYKALLAVDIAAAVVIFLVLLLGACQGNVTCLVSNGSGI
jgi:hypothetical protein